MKRKTILLVEDDVHVREVVKDSLGTEYDVFEAVKYLEATAYFKNTINLLIVDYILPDCDGFDLTREIRTSYPGIPVIMMTAYHHESIIFKALRMGMTDYIRKPLSLKYLKKRVAEVLEGKSTHADEETGSVGKEKDFLMDGIGEYIENNYMKDLTLDRLAKSAGQNKYDFCKDFKSRFGKSCISYLNDIRIRKAAELLGNHDLSITDIAFSIGFRSLEHFNRLFKEQYKICPRDYRKSL